MRATSWLTLATREPRPPTVHCSEASRPTRARSRLKCQVASSQFWILTSWSRALCARKTSTAPTWSDWCLAHAATGRFADQRGFGPVFEHDQGMAQVDAPLVGKADQTEERSARASLPWARRAASRSSRTPRAAPRRCRRTGVTASVSR